MPGKILVTTRSFRRIEGPHQDLLMDAGYEIVNSPYERPATADELAAIIGEAVAAILGVDEVTESVIQAGGQLKVLSRFGVGVDSVDIAAATRHGIPVTNTPGANSIAVAELAFALMLALSRSIPQQHQATKAGGWSPVSGWELKGSTLGLVGLGRIGQELALRAAAFGMKLQFYDPYPPPSAFIDQYNIQWVSLDALFATSDFISLHLPLNPGTQNMVNAQALRLFKPTAYLINTARGGLVDENALHTALSERRIAGAGFDCFEQEPPQSSPLLALDNFIATPHAGSATRQTTLRMGLMAAQNALAVLRGEQPEHTVNPEVYQR